MRTRVSGQVADFACPLTLVTSGIYIGYKTFNCSGHISFDTPASEPRA
jgi:hypothetical protein